MALEVAQKNITCNAICPGYVLTDLVKNQIRDTARRVRQLRLCERACLVHPCVLALAEACACHVCAHARGICRSVRM